MVGQRHVWSYEQFCLQLPIRFCGQYLFDRGVRITSSNFISIRASRPLSCRLLWLHCFSCCCRFSPSSKQTWEEQCNLWNRALRARYSGGEVGWGDHPCLRWQGDRPTSRKWYEWESQRRLTEACYGAKAIEIVIAIDFEFHLFLLAIATLILLRRKRWDRNGRKWREVSGASPFCALSYCESVMLVVVSIVPFVLSPVSWYRESKLRNSVR